jgi:hypothetical protein
MERIRRGLLAAGATAGLVSLSGCLGALGSRSGIGVEGALSGGMPFDGALRLLGACVGDRAIRTRGE